MFHADHKSARAAADGHISEHKGHSKNMHDVPYEAHHAKTRHPDIPGTYEMSENSESHLGRPSGLDGGHIHG